MRDLQAWMRPLLLCGLLAVPAAAPAQGLDNGAVLKQASSSYYSLKRDGFAGARCRLVPDWVVSLGMSPNDPGANKEGFAILEALQFTLTLDASAAATIDKRDPGAPRSGDVAAGVQNIFTGMDEAVGGFFTTWQLFMVNSPIPSAAQDVVIAERPDGLRLTYKDGDAQVVSEMSRAGELSRVDIRQSSFTSTILPRFDHAAGGLALSGYVADYAPSSGPGKVHLVVAIQYPATGPKVPSAISLDSTYDGQPSKMRLNLNDCRIDQNRK